MSKMIKVDSCDGCRHLKQAYTGFNFYCVHHEMGGSKIGDINKIPPNCPLPDFPETGGQTFMEWTEEMRRENER